MPVPIGNPQLTTPTQPDMSLWSSITGAVGGLITGGPMGAIQGAIRGWGGGGGGAPAPVVPAGGGPFSGGSVGVTIGGPYGITGRIGVGQWGAGGGQTSTPAASGGGCPRGYHLNKHALGASRSHGAVPARTICVRNRSMNPLNPRALRKALAREKRARKLLSKLHVFRPVRHAPAKGRKR